MGTDVFRVPPTRLSVTEPARGRMGPLQGHTAGSNNTYSTGQTVSQNNFIVPKIGVEGKAKTRDGRGEAWEGGEKEEKDAKREKACKRERERGREKSEGVCGKRETGKGGVPEKVQSWG